MNGREGGYNMALPSPSSPSLFKEIRHNHETLQELVQESESRSQWLVVLSEMHILALLWILRKKHSIRKISYSAAAATVLKYIY